MNFDYIEPTLPEDAIFKISPSGISKFFDNPVTWYKEHITKEAKFEGSVATVLGTVIHALGEAYAKGEPTDREACDAYIDEKAIELEFTPEEVEEIKFLYPEMAAVLINEYIRHNPPSAVEEEVCAHIEGGVYAAGTCDNRTNNIVVDYKNVSKKPNTDKIPFMYLIQMLTYAIGYEAKGIPIDQVRLVYTVRPTKTLGVRLFVVNHMITDEDRLMAKQTLQLITDTILFRNENPELDYLIFKSMNLQKEQ